MEPVTFAEAEPAPARPTAIVPHRTPRTADRRELPARLVDVVVVGAGQAGLSAAGYLVRRGSVPDRDHVVLDANDRPGGAWQHRWPSLRLGGVHGIHPLPGLPLEPGELSPDVPARDAVPRYFARYERTMGLSIHRPVRVRSVREGPDRRLTVVTDAGTWHTRTLINATGTWTRPFAPSIPGADGFRGRQLHTAEYPGPDGFHGHHVVVIGGGHSAVGHLAELAAVTSTTWVTRRPPRWRDEPFDAHAGREAVAEVERAVAEGRRPASVVHVTGLAPTPALERARELGALERLPMFDRITPDGVAWDGPGDGPASVRADVLLWATGFRHALGHLAPLRLRGPEGGIRMEGTHVAGDRRIHLLGYGPSASTVGANRAGQIAVREVRRELARA